MAQQLSREQDPMVMLQTYPRAVDQDEIITEKIEAADLLSWGPEFFPLTSGPYFGTSGHGSSHFTRSTPSFFFVTIQVMTGGGSE